MAFGLGRGKKKDHFVVNSVRFVLIVQPAFPRPLNHAVVSYLLYPLSIIIINFQKRNAAERGESNLYSQRAVNGSVCITHCIPRSL